MTEDLAADIKDAGAEVRQTALPRVPGRPRDLHRLLQNLLGNALKYRRPGIAPVISVTELAEADGVTGFEVSDNGIGIAPGYEEHVFGLFSRLHPKSDYPGTGLGLPICRRIVEAHGGAITLRRSPSGGCTFSVTLPATEAAAPRSGLASRWRQDVPAAPTSEAMIRAMSAQSSSENVSGSRKSINPSRMASVFGKGSDAA